MLKLQWSYVCVRAAVSHQHPGTVVLDTPWLYVRTAHKLSRLRGHTLQLTSELTATKWLTVHNLVLEAWCRDRGGEKEARLALYSPVATYLQAELWGAVGKRALEASGSLCSLWTHPLRGNVSLETSQTSHALQMNATYGGQNLSVAAALTSADKSLKKRQATLKMSFTKPASPAAEVELEVVVEELRRDKKMYQKTAVLHLRQPLQILPQALLLRETFTVDLLQGLYILETRAGIHSNREVIHTLTLGYKPSKPFVCSALIHPFSSETVPSDSEICVTVTSNQTHKDVRGRLRVGGSERLTFLGLAQTNPWRARYQALQVKATFSHQLQLQLPSSAVMEGLVRWTAEPDRDFDYQARGRLRVGRQECQLAVQLNGTSGIVGLQSSLSHPFKSKIPKTLEVRAAADVSVPGRGSSTVHVSADGKDRVMLNAQVSHILVRSDRAVGLRLNLSQSLLPAAADLHLNLAANTTSDSVVLRGSFTRGEEALLAQVRGSRTDSPGLRLALSGDLRHSLTGLSVLPPVLGLGGALGRSDGSIKGQLRVEVMDTVHSVELRHQTKAAGDEEGMTGEETDGARDLLCVRSGMEHLCVNVSRQLANQGRGEVFLQLCHSSHLLNVTGVPVDSSAQVKWSRDGEQLSVLAELQAGPEYLEAEFLGGRTDPLTPRWQYSSRLQHQVQALLKRGLLSSLKAKAHYQFFIILFIVSAGSSRPGYGLGPSQ
ncbi:uncharacterized protein LOC133452232 [Cololabis saira]|uniref:uncharacterized protein LOC133452232 n=1 Tax=Cololabis saira TaxID=129043 RepID=UPI002AD31014|nr:uncharacterized protein LOC133452232 [Cololabis saira]